jgi:hypothetical protein
MIYYIGGMTGSLLESIDYVLEEENQIVAESLGELTTLLVEPIFVVIVRIVVRIVVVVREGFNRELDRFR